MNRFFRKLFRKPAYQVKLYPEDFLPAEELGSRFPPYRPTYIMDAPRINAFHSHLGTCSTEGDLIDMGIKGFLRREDALKIYELAYHASGDVLEMGSAWGLSTSILCRAVADSGRGARVVSLEIDPLFHEETRRRIDHLGLGEYLDPILRDASAYCETLVHDRHGFDFAFIDHCHNHEATAAACRHLRKLTKPGGFICFHDFNDERNRTDFPGYGVYDAVMENLSDREFEFAGIFGCSGLYRRSSPGGRPSALRGILSNR